MHASLIVGYIEEQTMYFDDCLSLSIKYKFKTWLPNVVDRFIRDNVVKHASEKKRRTKIL